MKKFMLILVLILAACSPPELNLTFSDLPDGDAGNGEKIFLQSIRDAPACADCHNLDATQKLGPGLAGYGERAETIVADESAAEYTFYSIVRPSRHITRGYSNVMYTDYAEKLDAQDIADLIAYLLQL